jgi:hypothetical protein
LTPPDLDAYDRALAEEMLLSQYAAEKLAWEEERAGLRALVGRLEAEVAGLRAEAARPRGGVA